MQKSGILFFKKLCQKNVGFLLVGLMLVFSNNAMGILAPSIDQVPEQETCSFFNTLITNVRLAYIGAEKDENGLIHVNDRVYTIEEYILGRSLSYIKLKFGSMRDKNRQEYYENFILREGGQYVTLMAQALQSPGQVLTEVVQVVRPAVCPCPGGEYMKRSMTSLPECTKCSSGMYRRADDEIQVKCTACPQPQDDQTPRSDDGATSAAECYVDKDARFNDFRGQYGCGNDSGKCHYTPTTETE